LGFITIIQIKENWRILLKIDEILFYASGGISSLAELKSIFEEKFRWL
jgi:hypothetical protein